MMKLNKHGILTTQILIFNRKINVGTFGTLGSGDRPIEFIRGHVKQLKTIRNGVRKTRIAEARTELGENGGNILQHINDGSHCPSEFGRSNLQQLRSHRVGVGVAKCGQKQHEEEDECDSEFWCCCYLR